jgi:uncharacterized protein (DUF2164 family)
MNWLINLFKSEPSELDIWVHGLQAERNVKFLLRKLGVHGKTRKIQAL